MTLAEQTQPRCASATSSSRRTPRLAICSSRCVSESWPSSPSIGTESLPREQHLAFRSTRARRAGRRTYSTDVPGGSLGGASLSRSLGVELPCWSRRWRLSQLEPSDGGAAAQRDWPAGQVVLQEQCGQGWQGMPPLVSPPLSSPSGVLLLTRSSRLSSPRCRRRHLPKPCQRAQKRWWTMYPQR